MRVVPCLLLIFALTAAGCQSAPPGDSFADGGEAHTGVANDTGRPVAYLNGRAVREHELYALLVEMDGGLALSELLLDRAIQAELADAELQVIDRDLEAERQTMLDALSPDADEAVRLLAEMKRRRGLGERRFAGLLARNAGLRKLVRAAGQEPIAEPAIRQAYELAYGPRYTVRLIVTEQLARAQQVHRLVAEGSSFSDLAAVHSTDVSAAQGGLLSPISPADASYPDAVRDALPSLGLDTRQTRLSPVIAIDGGYALLWLDAFTPAQGIDIEDVRPELEAGIRMRLERLRMQQLARTLIDKADLVILDPALDASWEQQRATIEEAQR